MDPKGIDYIVVDIFKYQHKSKLKLASSPNYNPTLHGPPRLSKQQSANTDTGQSAISAETCKLLINNYFENWNPLFPILDTPDMDVSCEDSNTARKSRQPSSRVVLKHLVASVGSLSADVSAVK